jgi:tetratricopeptide (TPR) repeat protein
VSVGDGWDAAPHDLGPVDPEPSLDELIARLRLEFVLASGGSDEQHEILAELAFSLLERHQEAGAETPAGPAGTADLDEAIGYLEQLRRDLQPGPERAELLVVLAEVYGTRAGTDPDPADLDRIVVCLREVWDWLPGDDPARVEVAARFGLALGSRVLLYARAGQPPPDLEQTVEALTAAEHGLGDDGDQRELQEAVVAMLGLVLGAGVLFHLQAGAATGEELDQAVRQLERALSSTGDYAVALCRQLLGQLLLLRALPPSLRRSAGGAQPGWVPGPVREALSESALADLDRAIEQLGAAIDAPVDDPAFAGASLALLGQALLLRGASGLDAAERDRVIDCLAGARDRLPEALAGSAELVAELGMLVGARSRGGGARPDDADAAAEALAAAERLLSPGHPLLAAVLREHGLVLMIRGKRDQSLEALSRAAECLTAAAELLAEDDPQRLDTLGVLGTIYVGAVTIGTLPTPVSRGIALLGDALNPPPTDPVRHATFRWSLGMALGIEGIRERRDQDIDAALSQMTEAATLLPPDHEVRRHILFGRALVLVDRFGVRGEVQDLDAAAAQLEELDRLLADRDGDATGPEQLDRPTVRAALGDVRLKRATHRRQLDQLGGPAAGAVEDLRAGLGALPPGDPARARLQSELGMAILGQGISQQDVAAIRAGVEQIVAAARAVPAGHADQAVLLGRAGYVLASYGELHGDPGALDQGVVLLGQALSAAPFTPGDRVGQLFGLGHALVRRYQGGHDRRDLDAGIARLEEARAALAAQPASPMAATLLSELADAYRVRSDRDRDDQRHSVEAARAALREHARNLFLQTGAERGLALARAASEEVLKSTLWCLADGRPDLAVEVLETGRGLVLHAATVAVDVPDLLREAGHDRLAAEWEATGVAEPRWELGNLDLQDGLAFAPPEVPDDLRYRVLSGLDGAQVIDRLLSPPTVPEIATALRAGGRDALIYLLPRYEHAPGRAVLVSAAGEVDELPLYLLDAETGSQAAAYAAAQREVLASPGQPGERERAVSRWRDALEGLCEWAWEAAVAPLLDHLAGWRLGRPPRLALVPVGLLGAVPWHAARTRQGMPGDGYRHACELAVFSYAASARQLMDAIRRPRRALGSAPVIVANPTGDLPAAMLEARTMFERHYPQALYLGRPARLAAGTGTPDEVLAALPTAERSGASMLHLGCHARAGGSSAAADLGLAGANLSVTRILRQAHNRAAEAPGGLVVLAACTSDLTERDHDEALTLATTFMAAGAVSVVGSRWEVDDARTALLMVMFHHFLNAGNAQPADALRAAQLWMLDPNRALPSGVPPVLADAATRPGLDDVLAWAGFTSHGQ